MYRETLTGWEPVPDEPVIGEVPIPIIVTAPPVTVEDAEEELDLVAEQVGLLSIEEDERYSHLLERIEACQQRLESLSTNPNQTESPILNQILTEILDIKSRVERMESEHQNPNPNPPSSSSNLPPSESTESPESNPDALATVESTDEVNKPEPRVKRNRVI